MQREVEVKFLNINIKSIRKTLLKAGAEMVKPMRLMRRTIIKTPEMIKREAFAWVRDEGDKVTMTLKQINQNNEDFDEVEITVSDFEKAIEILTGCGIPQVSYQESRREEWRLDNVQICIDEWPWVNPYIELEGESEGQLQEAAKKLGFAWSKAVRGCVWEVYYDAYPHLRGTMPDVEFFRFGDDFPKPWVENQTESQKEWWNARFKNDETEIAKGNYAKFNITTALTDDLWIEDWKGFGQLVKELKAKNKTPTAIDLGCGLGQLSRYFSDRGFHVTALDFSETALNILKHHSPNVRTLVHDMTTPFPFADSSYDIVIANLTLHYFTEKDTRSIIAEIERILKPGGVLVGSVVSTEEYACELVNPKNKFVKFVEHEPNFFHEISSKKEKHIRFFSKECLDKFFHAFEFIYLENKFRQRMGKSKGAWEFVGRLQK